MKRVFSLLLSLFLFLPFVTLTGGLAEDDVVIEDLSDLDLQVDSDGKLVLGSERLSPEEIEKLNDLTAQVEFTEVDPADLYLNPNLPDNVINILLIGVDSRGTKDVQKLSDQMHYTEEDKDHKAVAKRSDVIMILSIDLDDGTIKLSSIARNTYVEIPDRTNKSIIANSFGHAIYKDGKYHSWIDTPAMCVATVNKNFQLNIQYYVAINFFGVEEIIEYLGGADIDLTKKEASAINTYLSMKTIYKKKNGEYVLNADGTKARASHGKLIASTYDNHSDNRKPLEKKDGGQHLDGLQALMYARLLEIDNDFQRTARTRHLLDSLLKPTMTRIKTGEMSVVDLISDWSPYFITNMPMADIADIAMDVLDSVNLSDLQNATSVIREFRIPEDGTYSYSTVNGASVTVMKNKERTTEALHEFIYGIYIPAE